MPLSRHSANYLFIFLKKLLCRVPQPRHSAKNFWIFKKILCRVPLPRHSAKFFFLILCRVPLPRHSAKFFFKKNTLPSAPAQALGKEFLDFFWKKLCRVPCPWHSAKTPRIVIFFTFHCNRQYIHHYISIITPISPTCIIYHKHPHI